jgi:hypothetical protein
MNSKWPDSQCVADGIRFKLRKWAKSNKLAVQSGVASKLRTPKVFVNRNFPAVLVLNGIRPQNSV